MKRKTLSHERVFTDPAFITRYAREQQRVFRWMHPAVLDGLRKNGFARGRILDAGCGPGYHAVGLVKTFPASAVVGVDLSEPLLAAARRHLDESGTSGDVRFESADVLALPFEENSFDAAICLFMFHIVEDPVRLCNEIERVVKPGGQIVLIDLRRSVLLSVFEREMGSCYTPAEALAVIGNSRLRTLRLKKTPIWWGFIGS